MAKIKVDDKTYPNIVVAYLLDMMIHSDEESGNELFDKLMKDLSTKGMFPILLRYFRSMDPTDRRKYKLIKKGVSPYDNTTENAVISVVPEKLDKATQED